MFIGKWKPVYAPELETGGSGGEGTIDQGGTPPPSLDGPGSGRTDIRKQLEKSFADDRKRTEATEKETAKKPASRRGPNHQEGEQAEQELAPQEPEQEQQEQAQPEAVAPDSWTKEAKAEWDQLSPTIKAMVAKREQDSNRGVEELKKSYKDLDEVLKPRLDVIKRNNVTPAQAVNQLFSWMEALTANPRAAFPALAQSFNFDLRTLFQEQPAAQPAKQPAKEAGREQTAEELSAGERALMQRIQQLESTFQNSSMQRTEAELSHWSKDKPYFEEVRQFMAHLVGSGAVPPLANGNADLDTAYDYAINAVPGVRAKIEAEKTAKAEADRKAKADAARKEQQAKADAARKASVSLTGTAPGAPDTSQPRKAAKGKSVRESIEEARRELAER